MQQNLIVLVDIHFSMKNHLWFIGAKQFCFQTSEICSDQPCVSACYTAFTVDMSLGKKPSKPKSFRLSNIEDAYQGPSKQILLDFLHTLCVCSQQPLSTVIRSHCIWRVCSQHGDQRALSPFSYKGCFVLHCSLLSLIGGGGE